MESIKGKCEGVACARWNTVTYQAPRRTLHTPLPALHGKRRAKAGDGAGKHTRSLHRAAIIYRHMSPFAPSIHLSSQQRRKFPMYYDEQRPTGCLRKERGFPDLQNHSPGTLFSLVPCFFSIRSSMLGTLGAGRDMISCSWSSSLEPFVLEANGCPSRAGCHPGPPERPGKES